LCAFELQCGPDLIESQDWRCAWWIDLSVHVSCLIRIALYLITENMPCNWLRYLSDRLLYRKRHQDIPPTEHELFADPLGRLLTCKPEDRPLPPDAIKHEWFKL
jgi:hypothetical protein